MRPFQQTFSGSSDPAAMIAGMPFEDKARGGEPEMVKKAAWTS
jgi:hypothetical protein